MKTTLFLLLLTLFAFNCKKDNPKPALVSNIIIKTAPTKVDYFNGDALNLAGLVVKLEFDNGSSEDISFSDFEAKGITTSITNGTVLTAPVSVNITHTASNKATSQVIGVTDIEVTSISIKTPPNCTTYYKGELLNLSGLVVTLNKNNNTKEDNSFTDFGSKGLTCNPANGAELTSSNTEVSITHTVSSKNTNQSIMVNTEITDIDNNKYPFVKIGNQLWMAANLKTTRYSNGGYIGTTNPANKNIESEISPKYQWAFNGDERNIDIHGRWYTWYAATDERNVCPNGWHVPSNDEWTILTNYLGGISNASVKMMEAGTLHWPSNNGTNESGFTAIACGARYFDGTYIDIMSSAIFITTSQYYNSSTYIWTIRISNSPAYAGSSKSSGFSIRCVRD
jgi:uncharacterized protein (TIGR02145 family)